MRIILHLPSYLAIKKEIRGVPPPEGKAKNGTKALLQNPLFQPRFPKTNNIAGIGIVIALVIWHE